MKHLFLILILILVTTSCSGARFGDYNNSVQSATNAATLACNTAALFSDASGNQGMDVASDKCLRAMDRLSSDEFQVVIAAAGCVYNHCGDRADLTDCLRGIEWAKIAEKISQGV